MAKQLQGGIKNEWQPNLNGNSSSSTKTERKVIFHIKLKQIISWALHDAGIDSILI